jgi:hypothetical protein
MNFQYSVVTTQPGDLIQVIFRGVGINVGPLNEFEFQKFCAGQPFAFRNYRTSPVHIRPHSAGRWHVVVHFGGNPGSVTAVTVIPYRLIRTTMQGCVGVNRVMPEIPAQRVALSYYTGEPIQVADEIEVFYQDLHGIPHRGIVHSFQVGPMGTTGIKVIHNSKRDGGVSFISFSDFAQGNPVNLRRRAASPRHTSQIIERAESAIHHPYNWWLSNCEHFTDWCYTGRAGESDTKKAGSLVAAGIAAAIWLWRSE